MITRLSGDCRDVLATLPERSIQCVITSPPYYGLRAYSTDPREIGREATPAEYVAALVAVFRAVWRVMRDDGTLFLNLGDSYNSSAQYNNGRSSAVVNEDDKRYKETDADRAWPGHRPIITGLKPKNLLGMPWRVAFALQDAGWILRSDIIWSKPNPMPESVRDRPTRAHEYVFMFAKQQRYFYDATAIAEAISQVSIDRINQPSFDDQTGGPKDYGATGINPARSMRKALGNFKTSGSATRNRRSVWTIATQPYAGSHFATMPEALIEPCILAGSASQACETCGAAWGRVVEREKGDTEAHDRPKRTAGMDSKTSTLSLSGNGSKEWAERGSKIRDLGFAPRCRCDANTGAARSIVLDPFGGSGTVARVAERFQRDSILIDLNADYLELQEQRTDGVQVEFTL